MVVKREASPEVEDIEELAPSTPTKKVKSTPKATPTKVSGSKTFKSPKSPTKSEGGDGGKKTGSWSGDELKLLYEIMCPKKLGTNWSEVSAQIPGRDAKSCNNKWSRMQGKILKAIEDMGE